MMDIIDQLANPTPLISPLDLCHNDEWFEKLDSLRIHTLDQETFANFA